MDAEATYDPILVLKAELGHSDLRSTDVYLRSVEQDASIVDDLLVSFLDELEP